MATVIIDLSVSLDGFIAGPGDVPGNALGDGGPALFDWMMAGPLQDGVDPRLRPAGPSKPVIDEWLAETGAPISGRRTFDLAGGWATGHPIDVPNFVVTHDPPTDGEWSPRVQFVTEGPVRALELAREVAGDRVIAVSAASNAQQLLSAGLVDEIQVSVTPVILGDGVRLFDHLESVSPITLEQTRVVVGEGVTHLRYRVVRD